MDPYAEKRGRHAITPTVVIYNNLETFYPFLRRFEDPAVLEPRKYRGDRALFWLGSDKLVIASSAIPDADPICRRYGYTGTRLLSPARTSYQLSLDIMKDPRLVAQIVDYAGPEQTIQLVPYATTQEIYRLADFLRINCGLKVDLPESPAEANFKIRDELDTKLGFRQKVAGWISDSVRLPRGYAVHDLDAACQAINQFFNQGLDCMVKPNRGESGLGIQFFDHRQTDADQLQILRSNAYLDGDDILVEEYIQPQAGLSPSLELFVPPLGRGEPFITYLSNQHFGQLARFNGVIIAKTYQEASWYPPLAENGLRIANQMQQSGYAGHFDLDSVIDHRGQVYLLEMNPRRTGGTHAHEFARFAFGDNYLEDVVLFSSNQADAAGLNSVDRLFERLSPLLFPICSEKRGVVVTVSSTLKFGSFGYLIAGASVADVLDIKQTMEDLLTPPDAHPRAAVMIPSNRQKVSLSAPGQ